MKYTFHFTFQTVTGDRNEEDPTSWALVLGKDTKKNLRSYLWQKQIYQGKDRNEQNEQKEHFKGEVSNRERHWPQNDELKGFLRQGFYIFMHVVQLGLGVLIYIN